MEEVPKDTVITVYEDLYKVALTAMTYEARNLLMCLLNPTKVLLSEGPGRFLRDWRGLANLVQIPSEIMSAFDQHDNKCEKVLRYWIERRDKTANIGQLLLYMKKMDRFDVFDDFMNLFAFKRLFIKQLDRPTNQALALRGEVSQWYHLPSHDERLITFDDKIHGSPQSYHGYILYAMKDRKYAMEMVHHMNIKGLKLCTEEDLIPGPTSVYELVIKFFDSKRCRWIVPIFTRDFLLSPVYTFYRIYTSSLAMESSRVRTIPCMFSECTLPPEVRSTLILYYKSDMYDFWERLMVSLMMEGFDSQKPTAVAREADPQIASSSSIKMARLLGWIDSLTCWRKRTEITPYKPEVTSN